MNTRFVSISNAVQDWLDDNDSSLEELDEPLILKWATDAIRMVDTPENKTHKLALIYVTNGKAELPSDFFTLQSVAGRAYKEGGCKRVRRERVVQWIQTEADCELEINLVCDFCKDKQCCCTVSKPIDVTRIWEQAHPEIYHKGYSKLGRFGYGYEGMTDPDEPKFQLLGYSSSNFFQAKHFLSDCPNVHCTDCKHTFRINQVPYIDVDFSTGELIVSYLGSATDENGDLMMPDHPDLHQAVQSHINFMWYKRQARKNMNNPKYNLAFAKQEAREEEARREDAFGKYRTAVTIPDIHEFREWTQNYWMQRHPNHDRHLNSSPGDYERYGRHLR
jgi:hypothetical protein